MAGDLIKFTGQNSFLPAMKLFLQKQAVVTTTMTNDIYNVLISPLLYLQEKKQANFFCPKNVEILVLCMFWANGAVHRVTAASHILCLQCVCGVYFPPHLC